MDTRFDAASIAVHHNGRFLLIERARPPYQGLWTLPGGHLNPGESPKACAERELFEELGISVAPEFVTSRQVATGVTRFHLAVFAGAYDSGNIHANNEVSSWGWYSIADIDGLRTTPGLIDVLMQASRGITGV